MSDLLQYMEVLEGPGVTLQSSPLPDHLGRLAPLPSAQSTFIGIEPETKEVRAQVPEEGIGVPFATTLAR